LGGVTLTILIIVVYICLLIFSY